MNVQFAQRIVQIMAFYWAFATGIFPANRGCARETTAEKIFVYNLTGKTNLSQDSDLSYPAAAVPV